MVELLSFFGPWIRENAGPEWYLLPAFYVIVVLVGLASFFLNSRRFSWARFLPFAVMSVIWGIFMNTNAMFAVVFAAVVGPNGQEWYHDQIGTEGRLGRLWTVWSTGGRLVTLALIFLMIGIDITGWNNTLHEVQFGLGYNPDVFAFEAAEFLANSKELQGNILNTSMPQGDALIWKGAPERQSYIDSRTRFFPPDLLVQWEKTRKAISEDDVETWKPLLDKYQISAIMIEAGFGGSPMTYQRLMQSPNWVPFYDDGRIVMFGRADAPESDLAFFKANRLDPDLRAFRTAHPVPGAERPPNPTSMIDTIFQTRSLGRLHSRTQSARRWLNPATVDDPAATPDSLALTRTGPLPARHPGSPEGAREKSRRLDRLPHPERGLPLPHGPGGGHAGGNPHHTRERESNPVRRSQAGSLDDPVPTARDGLELRDSDHAPAQITGVSARAAFSQPRVIPALFERECPGPCP